MKIIITGGSGFIGSNLVRYLIKKTSHQVLNIDKLTYAGNKYSLRDLEGSKRYKFKQVDIIDKKKLKNIFKNFLPDAVINLAAESHVDKSIDSPESFIRTNIIGTYNLLEVSRKFVSDNNLEKKRKFRFLHVSTDEVYGDLKYKNSFFKEETPYRPNSPYSASKAGSDHLVKAWNKTFNLQTIICNCSNNYGPYQLPEKFIPLIIVNSLAKKKLPIYGNGEQIRDWLYVSDHIEGLMLVLAKGKIGESYNIGASNEITNIELVRKICSILDKVKPINSKIYNSYCDLITYVEDRPGHDKRYAIDAKKIKKDLKWKPKVRFNEGLKKTIKWYLNNKDWISQVSKNKKLHTRQGRLSK